MRVYQSINAVQSALSQQGIEKSQRNNQGAGYNFRGIDQVYNTLSPLLAKHGLCILPRVVKSEQAERLSAKGGTLIYSYVTMEFDLVCAEDGSKHTICTVGEAFDSGDKSMNKAMSAAYKYACFQSFAIPTEGDNDADAHTHEIANTVLLALQSAAVNGVDALKAARIENSATNDHPVWIAHKDKLLAIAKKADSSTTPQAN
jgi:ERF superfamily